MRSLKFRAAKLILYAILIFCYLNSYGSPKVLIKANILLGENFFTFRTSAKEIENKVGEVLAKKGFEIVNNLNASSDILFVDLFVYRYNGQLPASTLTIRTENGIHYIDKEFQKKFFVDNNAMNLKLATELAERVPVDINEDFVYKLYFGDIIPPTNKDLNESSYGYKKGIPRYYSAINWGNNDKVPFIIPNEIELYLLYASNYMGLKDLLADGPIVLKLKINNSARFELMNISSPASLNEKQRVKIQEFIDSFPLWMVNTEVQNIEIMYGVKN